MKKRIISMFLVVAMVFSLVPGAAFAEDISEEVVEIAEELTSEEVTEEVLEVVAEETAEPAAEEATEAVPEETAEAASEEETEAASEETEMVKTKVCFVLAADSKLTVYLDDTVVEPEEDPLVYFLLPGVYTYSAEVKGCEGLLEGSFEVTEGMEELTVTPETEKDPINLPGLPEGYELTEAQLSAKAALNSYDVVSTLSGLKPGVDYEEGIVIFSAENEEDAVLVAEAYGAELIHYENRIAKIRLGETTVPDAVAAAADMNRMLPPVSPNYLIRLNDPVVTGDDVVSKGFVAGSQDWTSWRDSMEKPDELLLRPDKYPYQYFHGAINSFKTWGITTGDRSVKVAVVDTGVAEHEDLQNVVETGFYEEFESANDGNGHGTHCAGIIGAAMNNGIGGCGVAPDVSLYAYKCLDDDGGGWSDTVISGIYWAADQGVDIISMSLGSYFPNYFEEEAIWYAVSKGCTVVVAMGNDGSNIKCYPAAYNIPGLITVGATNRANIRDCYSNYGAWSDVLAPGTDIWSLKKTDNDYVNMSGTSMATPVVAGICALYMSKNGHVAPAAMEKAVKAGCTNGIVDAYKTVNGKSSVKNVAFGIYDGTKDTTGWCLEDGVVPRNMTIALKAEGSGSSNRILYTLDGTYPGMINGSITNGMIYDKPIDLSTYNVEDELILTAVCSTKKGEMGTATRFAFHVGMELNTSRISIEGEKYIETGISAHQYTVLDFAGMPITSGIKWAASIQDGKCKITKNGALTVDAAVDTIITVTATTKEGYTASKEIEFHALSLSVDGPSYVMAGKSATFKAIGTETKDKKIAWSVEGPEVDCGNVTISSKGVLKVNKKVGWFSSVIVTATLSNGDFAAQEVYIYQPAKSVKLYLNDGGAKIDFNKDGTMKEVVLFREHLDENKSFCEFYTIIDVYDYLQDQYSVTVSNPKVAAYEPAEENCGRIVAKGLGKTTVTVKALDGSGKTAKFTVRVVNPVSSITISTAAEASAYGRFFCTPGKSIKHKVTFGNEYGAPTEKNVEWFAKIFVIDSDSDSNPIEYWDESSGYVSIKNGTLKVNKSIAKTEYYDNPEYEIIVFVYAFTKDGTDLGNYISYYLNSPVTKVKVLGETSLQVNMRGREAVGMGFSVYRGDSEVSRPDNFLLLKATSSNPDVAGVIIDPLSEQIVIVAGQKSGTATITVKAIDGSGKTAKIKVKN